MIAGPGTTGSKSNVDGSNSSAAMSTVVTSSIDGSSVTATLSGPLPGTTRFCIGTYHGCTDSDIRLNINECDDNDGLVGLVVIIGGTVLIIAVFALRRYRTPPEQRLPPALELTTGVCSLDLLTDSTYVGTATFAWQSLFTTAVIFLVLPSTLPALYFLVKGYQLCTPANLKWRLDRGTELASIIYTKAYGQFSTITKVIAVVVTLGVYPLLLSVACAIAYVSHFFPLPIEVLWQPLRMVGAVTYRTTQAVFSPLKEFISNTWKHSIFGLLLVVIIGAVVGSIVVTVAAFSSTAVVVLLPFVYGAMVVFRVFVLAPRMWMWLRATAKWVLQDMQRPSDTGMFTWEPWSTGETASIGAALTALFGPTDVDLQLKHQLRLLAGTLVFEFIAETVPQLVIQGINNTARNSWGALATLSFTVSLGVGIDTLYKIGINVFYKKLPFGSPEAMGLSHDASEILKKRWLNDAARMKHQQHGGTTDIESGGHSGSVPVDDTNDHTGTVATKRSKGSSKDSSNGNLCTGFTDIDDATDTGTVTAHGKGKKPQDVFLGFAGGGDGITATDA